MGDMLQLGASYTGEPEDLLDLLPLQTRTVLVGDVLLVLRHI
jgi:hypothetical protein